MTYYHDVFIEKLPEVLQKDEQLENFKLLKEGHKEVRSKLITHNLRLVNFVISKYFYNTEIEPDELFSIGVMGLVNAVDAYDYRAEVTFSRFATICISNVIRVELNKRKHLSSKQVISLNTPIGEDGEDTIEDLLSTGEDITLGVIDKEVQKEIKEALKMLTTKEREVIILRYLSKKEFSQSDIARMKNCSRMLICNTEKKALGKMKNYFNDNKLTEQMKLYIR